MTRISILAMLMLAAGAARAEDKDKAECVAAYSSAQDLRAASKLVEAQRRLVVCTRASCPAFIARDCTRWLDEVEASTPTLVISAKDDANDITDVTVAVDGEPLLDRLDGRAIPMDPGPHTFTYQRADLPPITEEVVVRMGEKNRELVVDFTKPKPAVQPPAPPPPLLKAPPPLAPLPSRRPLATLGYVGIGVGGSLLVAGAVLGGVAFATKGSQCSAGVCEPGTVSTLWAEATLSTIGIVAGVALAAAGIALLFVHDRHPHAALLISPPLLQASF